MSKCVRVLVVDDSAFARKVIRESLEADPDIEVVGTARDGLEALEKIAELTPDVVTLDLVMPNLDGLGVLRTLPLGGGAPRVVVVSVADEESALGVAALRAGATDVVHKPTALATATLYELGNELRAKVKGAAGARLTVAIGEPGPRPAPMVATTKSKRQVLLIGASTGGPQAVTRLLRQVPVDFPLPICVVLHMPVGYTGPFAQRLDEDCVLRVREAEDGMPLLAGEAVIAQAGVHLKIARRGEALIARLASEPFDTPHKPAIDVLFASAASLGAGSLALIMTGMGDDGTAGGRTLTAAGGTILTESESSCVVYGMPRAAKEAGLSSGEAPLPDLLPLILRHL